MSSRKRKASDDSASESACASGDDDEWSDWQEDDAPTPETVALPGFDDPACVEQYALWKQRAFLDCYVQAGSASAPEGRPVPASRLLLACSSPYLKKLLLGSHQIPGLASDTIHVDVPGCADALAHTVEALYSRTLTLAVSGPHSVLNVLRCANYLAVSSVLDAGTAFLARRLRTRNCLRVACLAEAAGLAEARAAALAYAAAHFGALARTPARTGLTRLDGGTLAALLGSDHLVCATETVVFRALMDWLDAQDGVAGRAAGAGAAPEEGDSGEEEEEGGERSGGDGATPPSRLQRQRTVPQPPAPPPPPGAHPQPPPQQAQAQQQAAQAEEADEGCNGPPGFPPAGFPHPAAPPLFVAFRAAEAAARRAAGAHGGGGGASAAFAQPSQQQPPAPAACVSTLAAATAATDGGAARPARPRQCPPALLQLLRLAHVPLETLLREVNPHPRLQSATAKQAQVEALAAHLAPGAGEKAAEAAAGAAPAAAAAAAAAPAPGAAAACVLFPSVGQLPPPRKYSRVDARTVRSGALLRVRSGEARVRALCESLPSDNPIHFVPRMAKTIGMAGVLVAKSRRGSLKLRFEGLDLPPDKREYWFPSQALTYAI